MEERVAAHMLEVAERVNSGLPFEALRPVALWNLYICASLLYYREDKSLLTDDRYDRLCSHIADHITPIRETQLYDLAALRAGSGYHIGPMNTPYLLTEACELMAREL